MPNKQQKRERDRQDVVLFFELIQIAIGNRAHLSFTPNNIQWNNAFTIASQQSLIGITFVGLNKIPKSQMPNELLILKWFGMTELLVKRNKILNLQCEEVQKTLNECGLDNCILKGQSIGAYYGDIAKYRHSGDIDVWVDENIIKTIKWIKKLYITPF